MFDAEDPGLLLGHGAQLDALAGVDGALPVGAGGEQEVAVAVPADLGGVEGQPPVLERLLAAQLVEGQLLAPVGHRQDVPARP